MLPEVSLLWCKTEIPVYMYVLEGHENYTFIIRISVLLNKD